MLIRKNIIEKSKLLPLLIQLQWWFFLRGWPLSYGKFTLTLRESRKPEKPPFFPFISASLLFFSENFFAKIIKIFMKKNEFFSKQFFWDQGKCWWYPIRIYNWKERRINFQRYETSFFFSCSQPQFFLPTGIYGKSSWPPTAICLSSKTPLFNFLKRKSDCWKTLFWEEWWNKTSQGTCFSWGLAREKNFLGKVCDVEKKFFWKKN